MPKRKLAKKKRPVPKKKLVGKKTPTPKKSLSSKTPRLRKKAADSKSPSRRKAPPAKSTRVTQKTASTKSLVVVKKPVVAQKPAVATGTHVPMRVVRKAATATAALGFSTPRPFVEPLSPVEPTTAGTQPIPDTAKTPAANRRAATRRRQAPPSLGRARRVLPEAFNDTEPEELPAPGLESRTVATEMNAPSNGSDTAADDGAPDSDPTGAAAAGGDTETRWKLILEATTPESQSPPDARQDQSDDRLDFVDLEPNDDEDEWP